MKYAIPIGILKCNIFYFRGYATDEYLARQLDGPSKISAQPTVTGPGGYPVQPVTGPGGWQVRSAFLKVCTLLQQTTSYEKVSYKLVKYRTER